MIEVELKVSLTPEQFRTLPTHLASLQFQPARHVTEQDIYFNGKSNRDFSKTDEALRLRTCRDFPDGPAETLLTYKGPRTDPRSNTRKEYETTVGNFEIAQNILQELGFIPSHSVEKERCTYTDGKITVCLDQVLHLGVFMELEILQESGNHTQAVNTLLALLDHLGVSRENLLHTSYLELLLQTEAN